MTRETIKRHAEFSKLADACVKVTGIYPGSWNELKNAMRGHDKSLLVKLT